MSRPQPPEPSGRDDVPPASWMGAAGYTPYPENLPPHAPMPGAPPYPPGTEHPPPSVGQAPRRTGFGAALAAAAVWAAVNLVLVVVVAGAPPTEGDAGRFVGALLPSTLLAALGAWLVARRRAWSFWLLVAVAAPFFWVLRALLNLPFA